MKLYIYICFCVFLLVNCKENKTKTTQNQDFENKSQQNTTIKKLSDTKSYFYVYQIDDSVFLSNDIESPFFFTINSTNLDLGYQGRMLALTQEENNSNYVSIIDIAKRNATHLKFDKPVSVGNFIENSDWISLNYGTEKDFQTAFCNIKTQQLVTAKLANKKSVLYGTKFSPNGKYLLVHDMQNIYLTSFENGQLKPMNRIFNCQDFCEDDFGFCQKNNLQIDNNLNIIVYTVENYSDQTETGQLKAYRNLAIYNILSNSFKFILYGKTNVENFKLTNSGKVYYSVIDKDKSLSSIYIYDIVNNVSMRIKSFETKKSFNFSISQ